MKFFNKQENIEIEWWTDIPGLENVEPVRPALDFFPPWFKNMPKFTGHGEPRIEDKGTFKHCPGFTDFYQNAFVVPMWTDLEIEINGSGPNDFRFIASMPDARFEVHPEHQFLKYVPEAPYDIIFKFLCPWHVRTPPGYSMLQLPMFYNFDSNFEVLPGVIWTDIHHVINQQVGCKHKGRISFKRGTPLAMYVPYKRDSYKMDIKEYTDEYRKIDAQVGTNMTSKFIGAYKTLQGKIRKDG